jgi:protein-disulfide isomerase
MTGRLLRLRKATQAGFIALILSTGVTADDAGVAAGAADQEAELAKLMALVEKRRAPVKAATGSFDYRAQPLIGEPDAPVIIIEFGSYVCPYCQRHARQTMPRLLEHVARGEVAYVYHDFPSAEEGRATATAALCAAEQDAYVAFRDAVLANAGEIPIEKLPDHARTAGLDLAAFNGCLQKGQYVARVDLAVETVRKLKIRGTPTFMLGTPADHAGRMEVRRRIDGAQPYEIFQREIQALLEAG